MLVYPALEGYSRKVMTLTMILKNDKVLLGMKNRGIGRGKWNGFGGKVEPNETIDDAAKREVKEECGLDVNYMIKIAVVDFEFSGVSELMEGHIYMCNSFSGDIVESDEMAPIKWFDVKNLPYNNMWTDNKYWFPMILKQIPFKAHFKYLNDENLLDRTIIVLDSQKKNKETLVYVVIKYNHQILVHKYTNILKYLNEHVQVNQGESMENAVSRHLKNCYDITMKHNYAIKRAVVDVEILDRPNKQELNIFVVDVSEHIDSLKVKDFQWLNIRNISAESTWPDMTFYSILFARKQFRAYFLIDEDTILCGKYFKY